MRADETHPVAFECDSRPRHKAWRRHRSGHLDSQSHMADRLSFEYSISDKCLVN